MSFTPTDKPAWTGSTAVGLQRQAADEAHQARTVCGHVIALHNVKSTPPLDPTHVHTMGSNTG